MATELASAYVQILPSMKGIKGNLESGLSSAVDSAGKSSGSKLGGAMASGLKTTGKVAAAATGVATAAIGALTKKAVDGYASYEQLVGGVETLFGAGGQSLKEYSKSVGKTASEVKGEYQSLMKAQNTVLKNASKAYVNAGMSANDYMDTVTSFSASLIQSVGGDTQKAAKAADQAIIDMSDNANKMGTNIESIQTAYMGFAKQNYSMLDNLKLGYGGTQAEAYRLLTDAAELNEEFRKTSSFSLDSSGHLTADFADITKAIHIVQDNMGITGTTANEAATTIEGSVNTMKSAWSNLVVGLADDNADFDKLINQFVDSLTTASQNILPRIQTAVSGVGKLVQGLANTILPKIIKRIPKMTDEMIPIITSVAQTILSSIVKIFPKLINKISKALPEVVNLVTQLVPMIIDAIMKSLPALATAGVQALTTLFNGLTEMLPTIIPSLVNGIISLVTTLLNPSNLTALLDAGLQFIMALAQGIVDAIPTLIESLPAIIENITTFLSESIPMIMDAGIQLFLGLVNAIPTVMDTLSEQLPIIIETLTTFLTRPEQINTIMNGAITLLGGIVKALPKTMPMLLTLGPRIIVGIISGIISALPKMAEGAVEVFTEFVDTMKEEIKEIPEIGKEIITGIWDGISEKLTWLKDKAGNIKDTVVNGLKGVFGIHSPSKVMSEIIGKQIPAGIGMGIERNANKMDNALAGLGVSRRGTNLHFNGLVRSGQASTSDYNFNIPVRIGDEKIDIVIARVDSRNAYIYVTA